MRLSNSSIAALVVLGCVTLVFFIVIGKITQSLLGEVPREMYAEVSRRSVLSELPTENRSQRIAAIKAKIQELEAEKEVVDAELAKLRSTSDYKGTKKAYERKAILEKKLKILKEEDEKSMIDFMRSL